MDRLVPELQFKPARKKQLKLRLSTEEKPLKRNCYEIYMGEAERKVMTCLRGRVETENVAQRGDFIITGPLGETYVLTSKSFVANYNLHESVATPRPTERLVAKYTASLQKRLRLPRSLVFKAPWDADMVLEVGDYVVKDHGNRGYYRIENSVFKRTYEWALNHR